MGRSSASESEIKKAFRTQSMKFHPDRNPGCEDCAKKMQDLSNAYEAVKKNTYTFRNTVGDIWEMSLEQYLTTQLERWVSIFEMVSKNLESFQDSIRKEDAAKA